VTLLIVLLFAGLLLATAASGFLLTRRGADFVRVNSTYLELFFPDGRSISLSWIDSRVSFELYDASSTPRTSILATSPFFLRIRGTESTLSREAYEQIFAQASDHNLISRSLRGSRWVYPRAVAPIIHHVRIEGRTTRNHSP